MRGSLCLPRQRRIHHSCVNPRRLPASTVLIGVSGQLAKPLTLGRQHNATSVRPPRKARICGPMRRALRHCIATVVEVQWHAPGWAYSVASTRDILDPDQRPSSLSSTPGTACSPLSITKWSRSSADATPPTRPSESSRLTAHCLDADTRPDVNCRFPLAVLMASSLRSERRRSRYLPLKSRSSNRTDRHP